MVFEVLLQVGTNYLTNRKQFVVCDGIYSDYRTMLCGIPQGSILGPI